MSEQKANVQPAQSNLGRKIPIGLALKISSPVSVTPILCSHWDDSDLSRVTAVQPSDSTFTAGLPSPIEFDEEDEAAIRNLQEEVADYLSSRGL